MEDNVTAAHSLSSASQFQAQSTGGHICPCLSVPASHLAEARTVLCSARVHFPHCEQPGVGKRKPMAAGEFTGDLASSWIWWWFGIILNFSHGLFSVHKSSGLHQSQTSLKKNTNLLSFRSMELFPSCSSQNHGVVVQITSSMVGTETAVVSKSIFYFGM